MSFPSALTIFCQRKFQFSFAFQPLKQCSALPFHPSAAAIFNYSRKYKLYETCFLSSLKRLSYWNHSLIALLRILQFFSQIKYMIYFKSSYLSSCSFCTLDTKSPGVETLSNAILVKLQFEMVKKKANSQLNSEQVKTPQTYCFLIAKGVSFY